MLKLILGRAKTGKTAAVMESAKARVVSREGFSVLLIPEQYSHEAERELLTVCGDSLSLYAEVLSFTRLAGRVEAELGFSRRTVLDKGGRLLCLARALDAVGSRLKLYGAARRQPPLQQQLLSAIDEFKTGCMTPEDVSALAEGRDDTLGDKLRDLALVYGAFEAVAAQSGLDPMDRLTLLAEHIGESRFAKAEFYIDGFTDFTAQENRVIEALLRAGADVTVCLTADGLEESHEIFEPSRRAAGKLLRLAESLGIPAVAEVLSSPAAETPMEFLEQELFSFGKASMDAGGAVSLCCAADLTGECEAAAARCLQLVRETGCRWRDIAVAARSWDVYQSALESVFAHYGVPLYTARKTDILSKPLAALIASAYAVVTGGWDYDDIFAYLKTGLAGLSAAECDALENYAFLWSLRGTAWTKDEDWTLHPGGMAQEYDDGTWAALRNINALRRRAAAPLKVLAEAGGAAATAEGQALALAAFFDALSLPEILTRRAAELKDAGHVQEAAEYAQLWDITVSALEQCAAILGDAEMDTAAFGQLFCLVLSAYDVGSIPLSLDRVTAGDMDRMRRRHIRHLIVLGCDSASLPRTGTGAGIFTDEDREDLIRAGAEIGDTAAGRLYREFALIYNCLTLPEETLSLSWCAAGADGGQTMPAFVAERAAALFGLRAAAADTDLCRESAPGPAFELAAEAEGGARSPVCAAARRYFAEKGSAEELQRLSAAAHLTRGRLSRSAVRSLYGDTLRLSASRIDRFASCPFSYFLQYGLKARPRQAAEFAPPDMGTFMHFVLENTARELRDGGGFSGVSREAVEALCDKYVEQYVREKLCDFRQRSPRFVYLFRRLIRNVRAVVCDMVEELQRGDFTPLDFELNFGDREQFPPIRIGEGEDSLVLTGIADRVDGWLHDGRLYLRVVDYKTGRKAFSLSDVWYGMGLQMLLYLFALQRSGRERYGYEIVPAGVLYIPARDVLLSARAGITAEEIAAGKAKALKRSGLLLDDGLVLNAMERGQLPQYLPVIFKNGTASGDALASAEHLGLLSRHIDETLQAMAGELHGGSIAADPWFRTETDTACRLCDYAGACHFSDGDDHIRYLPNLRPAQVWDLLEKGGETQK